MGFSRQEYWNGLPCPPPGNLPDPGIKLPSLMSPALAGGFFTTSATWEAHYSLNLLLLFLPHASFSRELATTSKSHLTLGNCIHPTPTPGVVSNQWLTDVFMQESGFFSLFGENCSQVLCETTYLPSSFPFPLLFIPSVVGFYEAHSINYVHLNNFLLLFRGNLS